MQSLNDVFEEKGIKVFAISTGTQEELAEKMLPKDFGFPLLSDPDLIAIDAFGLRHPNGNPFGGDIARPAVLLIDEEGRITEKLLTENWRVRPTPELIREKLGI